jgi:hypothetical protein
MRGKELQWAHRRGTCDAIAFVTMREMFCLLFVEVDGGWGTAVVKDGNADELLVPVWCRGL